MYKKARAEGGRATVYMGGDTSGFWDFIPHAFLAQFPGIQLHMVTDLSKYHYARIYNQLATGDVVADVAIVQTTQDFEQWKADGELLKYRPIGWERVFDNAKDLDGYWTGAFYAAFSPVVNTKFLPADPSDFRATDLLNPAFANKIASVWPNDDDAILFQYKLFIDQYGWSWLDKLVAQNPKFLRGGPNVTAGLADGTYLATPAMAGVPSITTVQVLPRRDQFVSWAQRAAILRRSRHPATAKLFVSWLLSAQTQKSVIGSFTWPVRGDVPQPAWLKPLADYRTTDPLAFPRFMRDRGAVERFRSQVELYVGLVQGPDPADPAGTLGRTPGRF
ncbi:ABC transporter substrate-binding protein [Streptomyces sp. NPDC091280]|uniref:ABC transporter substrate-binding protein n=1 Tax=Streptomyces sp. NPDC091280 TaxID=3365984 RepID=UPI003801E992